LILVADLGGPTMFARIAVMRALNRHVERVFNHDRKDHYWGCRSWRGIDEGFGKGIALGVQPFNLRYLMAVRSLLNLSTPKFGNLPINQACVDRLFKVF
jgi:hypothetical protein